MEFDGRVARDRGGLPLPLSFSIVNRLSRKGDGAANDDAIGHCAAGVHADFWVIDGATSVADKTYVPRAASDPAWFAETLSSALEIEARAAEMKPEEVLANALTEVRTRYAAAVGGIDAVPVYARPLASITYVRASMEGGALSLDGICLGDCPAFASDGRAWATLWRPQVDGDPPHYLAGIVDRAEMKERIRRRRAEQHAHPSSGIAALDPACVEHAKRVRFEAGAGDGARLVLMTDGLARLFQEYRLMSAEEVMRELETEGGAERLYDRLRAAETSEAQVERGLYKGGDDASVISVRFDGAR
jgi:hypothetical protein